MKMKNMFKQWSTDECRWKLIVHKYTAKMDSKKYFRELL